MRFDLAAAAAIAILLTTSAAKAEDADAAASGSPCVDVEIGGDRSQYFDCLNEDFERKAEREQNVPQPEAPIDAKSSSVEVGTANTAAARQRMGTSFGKSAIPQRPNRVFINPILSSP